MYTSIIVIYYIFGNLIIEHETIEHRTTKCWSKILSVFVSCVCRGRKQKYEAKQNDIDPAAPPRRENRTINTQVYRGEEPLRWRCSNYIHIHGYIQDLYRERIWKNFNRKSISRQENGGERQTEINLELYPLISFMASFYFHF